MTATDGTDSSSSSFVINVISATGNPTVTLSLADGVTAPVKDPFLIDIVFDRNVENFVLGDLDVTNGVVSSLVPLSGSKQRYQAEITPTENVIGNLTVDLPKDSVQDEHGNNNVAATQLSVEVNSGKLTLNKTEITLQESDDANLEGDQTEAEWTVKLSIEPTGNVTVTISSQDYGAVKFKDGSEEKNSIELTFTDTNWNTAQTVTVKAQSDDDGRDENVTIIHSAEGGDFDNISAELTVTVDDDETQAITLNPSSLSLNEGDTDRSYTVVLTSPPTGDVTVTVESPDTGAVKIKDSDSNSSYGGTVTLTFTTDNWSTTQTVMVQAEQDDADDETVQLSHRTAGGGYNDISVDLTVTVEDDETLGLKLSETSPLNLSEGGEGAEDSYTVVLESKPTANVTVTVRSPNTNAVKIKDSDSGSSYGETVTLTFTVSNWETPQTVMVQAQDDDDGVGESVELNHSAAGGGYDSISKTLTVEVDDDEPLGLALSQTGNLELNEGAEGNYTVVLEGKPKANVTVTVRSPNTNAVKIKDSDSGSSYGETVTLTFTTSNWNTPQTVNVQAEQDDEGGDDSVVLSHSAAGGGYDSVSVNLTVDVTDDEEIDLTLSQSSPLSVDEDVGSTTYTVVLDSKPTGDVTITLGGEGNGVTVSTANGLDTLVFTASNWNTAQTVTLTVTDDAYDNDDSRSATITHSAAGGGYDNTDVSLTVNVTDDDAAPEIQLSVSPDEVTEGAAATSVTVTATINNNSRFDSDQTVNIEVGASSDTATEGTDYENVGSLTITLPKDGSSGTQTFSLTTKDNDIGEGDESISVTGSLSNITVNEATLTLKDDEEVGLTLSPSSLTVTEGASGSYTVALSSKPTADVTVTVSSGNTSAVQLSKDDGSTYGNSVELAFSTSNWATEQTVTVKAEEDDNSDSEEVKLAHTGAGGDYASFSQEFTVTVTDNDNNQLTLSATEVTVNEVDDTATGEVDETQAAWTVKLSDQPTADVTVTVSSPNVNAVKVKDGNSYDDSVELTFTTSDWNAAQTVTVQAVDDKYDNAGDKRTVNVSLESSNGGYDDVDSTVAVTVTDNEEAPTITLTVNPNSVAENAGETLSVEVTATVQGSTHFAEDQTLSVTVGDSNDSATEGTDYANVDESSLSITLDKDTDQASGTVSFDLTPTNDSVVEGAETLTVQAQDDKYDNESRQVELTLDPSGGDYESVSNSTATVTVTATIDNDSRFASDQSVSIEVGATGDSATEGSDYTTVNTLSLTLAKDAASGTKGFTLTLSDDAVAEGAESIAVSGTLSGFTVSPTTVTINDNETLSFTLSESSLSLSEGVLTAVTR